MMKFMRQSDNGDETFFMEMQTFGDAIANVSFPPDVFSLFCLLVGESRRK